MFASCLKDIVSLGYRFISPNHFLGIVSPYNDGYPQCSIAPSIAFCQ